MIDISFIEKIEQLSANEIIDMAGRKYSTKKLHPVMEPETGELPDIHTLSGIVSFLETVSDKPIILVEDHDTVHVFSDIFGPYKQREKLISSRTNTIVHYFDSFRPIEQFIIYLQSAFVRTEHVEKILKIVGNLSHGSEVEHSDDGVTQRVTAKVGIARLQKVDLPSPVPLMPYRTFQEIEQPESGFILRIKSGDSGLSAGLWEADGGAWKSEAISRVAEWLNRKCDDITVIA